MRAAAARGDAAGGGARRGCEVARAPACALRRPKRPAAARAARLLRSCARTQQAGAHGQHGGAAARGLAIRAGSARHGRGAAATRHSGAPARRRQLQACTTLDGRHSELTARRCLLLREKRIPRILTCHHASCSATRCLRLTRMEPPATLPAASPAACGEEAGLAAAGESTPLGAALPLPSRFKRLPSRSLSDRLDQELLDSPSGLVRAAAGGVCSGCGQLPCLRADWDRTPCADDAAVRACAGATRAEDASLP